MLYCGSVSLLSTEKRDGDLDKQGSASHLAMNALIYMFWQVSWSSMYEKAGILLLKVIEFP